MSFVQKFVTKLPKKWAESIEAESRTWMMQCPCGNEISVWQAGGVRYKAAGNPRRLLRCTACGKRTMHRLYRKE